MNEEQFRELVDQELAPMLGASVEIDPTPSTSGEQTVAYDGPDTLLVKLQRSDESRLKLRRSRLFDSEERRLAGDFVASAAPLGAVADEDYYRDLIKSLPRWVVARHLGPRALLGDILDQLDTWSAETYEGHRIACAIGVDVAPGKSQLPLDDYWQQVYAPVLSNGYDTFVVVGNDGKLARLDQLSVSPGDGYAPLRLGQIATWTKTSGRVAAVLNTQAEVLVFKGGSLRFAKRAGKWIHVVHDNVIQAMAPQGNRQLREEVYKSCLDVSFVRSGGCIAIVRASERSKVLNYVAHQDTAEDESSFKGPLLKHVMDRPFPVLDRRLRQEILALDGALVLSHKGDTIAAGAIVQVPGGSTGGGRRAAAVALSNLGVAAKISADGPIEIFKDGNDTATARVF